MPVCLIFRSAQYVSPYPTDASLLSQPVSQSAMMGIPNQTYYDASSLQHMGMHGGDHSMQHATRAHPQTVSTLTMVGGTIDNGAMVL